MTVLIKYEIVSYFYDGLFGGITIYRLTYEKTLLFGLFKKQFTKLVKLYSIQKTRRQYESELNDMINKQ